MSAQLGFMDRYLGPAKKRLCWCNKEEEEVTIQSEPQAVLNANTLSMKALGISEELPMPSTEEEVNEKFSKLVKELGLDRAHEEAMFSLPLQKKWQIYCSRKMDDERLSSSCLKPGNYIDTIREMSSSVSAERVTSSNLEEQTQFVERLKTALRTQPMSFVLAFLDLGGLNCLLDFLGSMDDVTAESSLHTAVIGCIQNLMNSLEGRSHVLAQPNSICRLAESLHVSNVRTKIASLEILGAMCIVPGGHRKVIQAVIHFQTFAKERARFQTIIVDLDKTQTDYKLEVALKTAIMSFINAVINYGPGQTRLEFRLHLRYEFLMLGIQSILEKLRKLENVTINRHLDFFELVRVKDEKELAKRFDVSHIDSRSATAMFELLRKKLSHGPCYSNLQSMLFHLLELPFASTRIIPYWTLIDRVIQQIVLQQKDGDPDTKTFDIDVKKLISQLTKEESIKDSFQKFREMQKENEELLSKLTKRERECQSKAEEKEELLQTLNRMKLKKKKVPTATLR